MPHSFDKTLAPSRRFDSVAWGVAVLRAFFHVGIVAKKTNACNLIAMRRALIIRFSALGDIVLTFPSIDHLVSAGYEVHFFTKKKFAPLVAINGGVKQVHVISDHAGLVELFQTVQALRRLKFDAVYDLHRNIRSWIVISIIGTRSWRISKFRLRELFLYLFHRNLFAAVRLKPIGRAAEAMRLVGGGPIPMKQVPRTVPVMREDARAWARAFASGYICISAESAWKQKEWPLERFAEVAQRVNARGLGVVWLGLTPLPVGIFLSGVLNLTGKLDVPEAAGVLSGARLLLCNDSGLMHLAEAVGTPVVAIFGPTSRELGFAPRLQNSRVVETGLWCRPCSKTGRWCIRPVKRRKCLADISVNQVYTAVEGVMRHEHARRVET